MREQSGTKMRRGGRAAALARVAVAVAVAALAVTLAGCSSGSTSASSSSAPSPTPSAEGSGFDGAAIPAGAPARDFTLRDQSGRRVSLSAYRGQAVILAFPYSTCAGACVVIAQQIRGALDELDRPVPVLFVSADPRADMPANVRRFLQRVSLGGRVHYLTGSSATLAPIWRAYHVKPASAGRAAFDRFASVSLLDRRGRLRVLYQLEQLTPEALAHDLRKLY
jgi:protein SCO1